jgi:hypothetical protein
MAAATGGLVIGGPAAKIPYKQPSYQEGQGYEYDPNGSFYKTPVQKATDAGSALNALAKVTGLPLLGSMSGSSASGSGAGGGSSVPQVQMPDTSGAVNAAFARGKDQAGSTARAALSALQEEMAGRNMLGSGQEAMATADVVGKAGAGVNELTREQAIKSANFANQRGLEQYKGLITQRGQDLNVQQENARRAQQAMEGLLSVIGGTGLVY